MLVQSRKLKKNNKFKPPKTRNFIGHNIFSAHLNTSPIQHPLHINTLNTITLLSVYKVGLRICIICGGFYKFWTPIFHQIKSDDNLVVTKVATLLQHQRTMEWAPPYGLFHLGMWSSVRCWFPQGLIMACKTNLIFSFVFSNSVSTLIFLHICIIFLIFITIFLYL
jgi:hypothetical protein